MIVDKRRGAIILVRETLPPLLILALWDFVVVILFQVYHQDWMEQPVLPISVMGSALALALGVRNNAAYARWWEARTLWGAITNNCRSFGREAASLLEGRADLARAMAAYPHALRAALRGNNMPSDLERLLPSDMLTRVMARTNKPNAVLYEIGLGVQATVAERGIDGAVHGTVDRILSDLANAQGGLERIRNTPLPIQYSLVPLLLVHVFCIVLPLSAVQTLGWITPLGSSLIGFVFQALDKTGRDLQEPFARSMHALPMLAMSRTIETDLLQPIGETPEPAPGPQHGVLW
jgi:ion channel-forming bestrophin family protein